MKNKLNTWPLRKGLTLAMVFSVALALIIDRAYEYKIIKTAAIEKESLMLIKEMSYTLARDYSHLLMINNLHELKLSISARSTQAFIKKIIVTDEWGKVIASTNLNDNGHQIADEDDKFSSAAFNKSITNNSTLTFLSDNKNAVLGYTPVSLPPNSNELRSLRQGILFIHLDITIKKAEIWNNLFSSNSLLRWLLTFVLVIFLLGYFLKRHLFKPLRHLEKMALRLSKGDWSAQSNLMGDSELAKLGNIFNHMRQEILSERKLLLESEEALLIANKQLKKEVSTDALTLIANRRKMMEVIKFEFDRATRYNNVFSIIMIDIDYFKAVNDAYGHDAGDEVLRQIAEIINGKSRKADIAGRWGGEEFLVLCPETNLNEAASLAELLRRNIEAHDFHIPISLTASFGVSSYHPNCTQDHLIKLADEALYAAKNNNRNNVKTSTV